MIRYNIGIGVEAFTAGRGEELPYPVVQAHQVHGCKVAVIDQAGVTREELEGFDALVTDVPGVAIGVRTADCIPVLLYDPVHRAVAAVHAGWKGTLVRISRMAIFEMSREYGTAAEDLLAVIGPGICGACFQVGEEVAGFFKEAGFQMDGIYSWNGAKVEDDMKTGHHIDLPEANRRLLVEEGVRPENIQVSGLCPYETEGLYSARREGLQCGRNINAIMLAGISASGNQRHSAAP